MGGQEMVSRVIVCLTGVLTIIVTVASAETGHKIIILVPNNGNWSQARQDCQQTHNGTLVSANEVIPCRLLPTRSPEQSISIWSGGYKIPAWVETEGCFEVENNIPQLLDHSLEQCISVCGTRYVGFNEEAGLCECLDSVSGLRKFPSINQCEEQCFRPMCTFFLVYAILDFNKTCEAFNGSTIIKMVWRDPVFPDQDVFDPHNINYCSYTYCAREGITGESRSGNCSMVLDGYACKVMAPLIDSTTKKEASNKITEAVTTSDANDITNTESTLNSIINPSTKQTSCEYILSSLVTTTTVTSSQAQTAYISAKTTPVKAENSKGTTIGIVVAVLVVAIIIVALLLLLRRSKRKSTNQRDGLIYSINNTNHRWGGNDAPKDENDRQVRISNPAKIPNSRDNINESTLCPRDNKEVASNSRKHGGSWKEGKVKGIPDAFG